MSYLYLEMKERGEDFDEGHQGFANELVKNIRSELLFEFSDLLFITEKIDPAFIQTLIEPKLLQEKWIEASVLIAHFKLQEHYPCKMILEKLALDKKIGDAKSLCDKRQDL